MTTTDRFIYINSQACEERDGGFEINTGPQTERVTQCTLEIISLNVILTEEHDFINVRLDIPTSNTYQNDNYAPCAAVLSSSIPDVAGTSFSSELSGYIQPVLAISNASNKFVLKFVSAASVVVPLNKIFTFSLLIKMTYPVIKDMGVEYRSQIPL
jgi:hypothetical protein